MTYQLAITLKHLAGKHRQQAHAHKSSGSKSTKRVWDGQPVEWAGEKPSKLEVGEAGERLAIRLLSKLNGTSFIALSEGLNNAPIDIGGDRQAVEVKTGLASNGRTAQHWRATIGQPGKEETELIRQMSSEDKKAHHAYKQKQIMARKHAMLAEMSKIAGGKVKPVTIGIIMHPNMKRADVYKFDGFHQRIPWKDAESMGEYLGTHEVD